MLDKAKMEELCSLVTDGTHDSPKILSSGVPFIKGKHVSQGFIDFESCDFISQDDHLEASRRVKPQVGDVLFSNIGSVGDTARVSHSIEFSIKNVALFRPNQEMVDSRYFYYLVTNPQFKEEILNLRSGSAQPFITLGSLRGYETTYHADHNQQRLIAMILSTYDDLIENNTRRIAILEEMARRIYEEWFVRFRFPGHEVVRMVESALGLVPEGWEVCHLGDKIELAYGKALKAEDRQPGAIPVYGSSGIIGQHSQALVAGPGIVVGRKGNVGSIHWSEVPFYPIDTVFYVKTALPLNYVYFNLQRQNFLNNDAAVPGLNRNQAYSLPLIVPPSDVLVAFDQLSQQLLGLARVLDRKNTNLRATRDLLLPKLISGEIDVSAIPAPESIAA